MSSSSGKGRKRKSNFDQVPADDNFRNYMKNKIKLQRKQFGLQLPPPPKSSPSPHRSQPSPATSAHNTPPPTILKRSIHSGGGYGKVEDSPAKSVRFHADVNVDSVKSNHDHDETLSSSDPISISDVLSSLKQRRTPTKRRRKRGRKLALPNCNQDEVWNKDVDTHTDSLSQLTTSPALGVLDVLDNLQKKHGASSSSGRRRSSSSTKNLKHSRHSSRGMQSSLETLDIGTVSIEQEKVQEKSIPSLSRRETTPTLKSRLESPRYHGTSVLEGLKPDNECNVEKEAVLQSSNDEMTKKSSSVAKSHKKLNDRPDLFFLGIVVLVNGYTQPDAEIIKRLLQKHGGDLEKYETSRVTHIIAEQLSTAKANIYKRQKKPTPVCTPNWIMDSIEKRKLLPYADYLLKGVMDKDVFGSKKVKSYFSTKPNQSAERNSSEGANIESKSNEIVQGVIHKPPSSDQADKSVTGRPYRWQDKDPHEANHMFAGAKTVGNDPNFLESYFSNSRLSYIGSFKQRVKTSATVKDGVSSARDGYTRFVMLVDMDCFFASVVLRKYPQHRSKPVAVAHAHSNNQSNNANSSSELSTCNYLARQKGVKKGMFLGDAIVKCPDLIVLPYDFEGFQEVSGIVADLLQLYAEKYSGCIEQVSCDEAYVEVNIDPDECGDGDIHDFVKSLAEHIRADIVKKTECTASIGIGANKLLAKLAADKIKPNGCYVCRDWKELLGGLDLRDIPGVGWKSQKKLEPRGLRTVTDVWDLDDEAEAVLGEIIGVGNAQKVVKFCFGKDDRPVTPAVRKSIGAECNYGVRFDGSYGVDYMMQGLAKEVETRMTAAELRGSKLTLKVMKSKDTTKVPGKFLGHGSCHNLSKSSDIPLTRDKEILASVGMKLLDKLDVDVHSIRGMGLVVTSLTFDGENDAQSSSPLSSWLNKVKSRTRSSANDAVNEVIDSGRSNAVVETTDEAKTVTFEEGTSEHTPRRKQSLMPSTFSQIDEDVLQNLPEHILDELKSEYKTSRTTAAVSGQSPNKQVGNRKIAVNKEIPIQGQVSVRRMFKLNSIKTGEDTLDGGCTLSQLDSLPLEVQLQIANNDNTTIAKNHSRSMTSRKNMTTYSEIIDLDSNQLDTTHTKVVDSSVRPELLMEDSRDNFFQENIVPLKDFILANLDPTADVVETVREFLITCVGEGRSDDVVVLLRAIKSMPGGWKDELYNQLRDSVVSEIFARTGDRLDLRWLGL